MYTKLSDDQPTPREVCKLVLERLLDAEDRRTDAKLRDQLRMCIRQAHESNVALRLSEPGSTLGELMFYANNRARLRGWL